MRDAKKGTYDGEFTFCPVNAIGDCPYCDKKCVCHVEDPCEDCDDWQMFWGNWQEWKEADYLSDDAPKDFSQEEIEWAKENYDYEEPDDLEIGFDPYAGCYTYDC